MHDRPAYDDRDDQEHRRPERKYRDDPKTCTLLNTSSRPPFPGLIQVTRIDDERLGRGGRRPSALFTAPHVNRTAATAAGFAFSSSRVRHTARCPCGCTLGTWAATRPFPHRTGDPHAIKRSESADRYGGTQDGDENSIGIGIMLTPDEIQTGIGRIDGMVSAGHFGVEPDAMALGKGFDGSGAAVFGSDDSPNVELAGPISDMAMEHANSR